VVFAALILGVLTGGIATWIGQGRHRKVERMHRRDVERPRSYMGLIGRLGQSVTRRRGQSCHARSRLQPHACGLPISEYRWTLPLPCEMRRDSEHGCEGGKDDHEARIELGHGAGDITDLAPSVLRGSFGSTDPSKTTVLIASIEPPADLKNCVAAWASGRAGLALTHATA
jgi:hypothetical protein